MFFRGIYFPQKGAWGWLRLLFQNRRVIARIVKDSFRQWHGEGSRKVIRDFEGRAIASQGD
jgi:hypothetical protein